MESGSKLEVRMTIAARMTSGSGFGLESDFGSSACRRGRLIQGQACCDVAGGCMAPARSVWLGPAANDRLGCPDSRGAARKRATSAVSLREIATCRDSSAIPCRGVHVDHEETGCGRYQYRLRPSRARKRTCARTERQQDNGDPCSCPHRHNATSDHGWVSRVARKSATGNGENRVQNCTPAHPTVTNAAGNGHQSAALEQWPPGRRLPAS